MSRIESLKKEFPYLNISFFDLLTEIDGTKTHKYLQLLCKIFGNDLVIDIHRNLDEVKSIVDRNCDRFGLKREGNLNTDFVKNRLLDSFRHSDLEMFLVFKQMIEKGYIEQNDVSKYSDMDSIRDAISLAQIKRFTKELESQVYKEYEDDIWLLVRPLSFESSSKYGAGTKWCTTYEREKNYFYKYFKNGALVYIINKKTGYKAAMYAEQGKDKMNETTFWNSADSRVDFIDLEIDLSLIDVIRRIKNENRTNSSFCTKEQNISVEKECFWVSELREVEPVPVLFQGPIYEETELTEENIRDIERELRGFSDTVPNMTA